MVKDDAGTGRGEIAVGVPMFQRTGALANFLESVPEYVSTVYVADNGHDADRDVYGREWPFSLNVLELDFDVGIGACRTAIVEACSEPYLWVGDNDMEFCRGSDLRQLRSILEKNPDVGAVSGWLVEGDTVRSGARNLKECGSGYAVKVADDIGIEHGPLPFTCFDFIPQAALFRCEVFEDYTYDETVGSSEHFDFFWGHKQSPESGWKWASTPAVMVIHHRDIDEEYRESERGYDHADMDRMREKWGIGEIVPGPRTDWTEHQDTPVVDDVFDVVKRISPPRVWVPLKRAGERVLK